MTAMTETVLDEFYSRSDRQDVRLVERKGAGAAWYVVRYGDAAQGLGFNDLADAKRHFNTLKMQEQNP